MGIQVAAAWLSGDEYRATFPASGTCADLWARLCADKGLFLSQLRVLVGGAVVPPAAPLRRYAVAGAVSAQALAVGDSDWPCLECVFSEYWHREYGPTYSPEGLPALARAAAREAAARPELWPRYAAEFYDVSREEDSPEARDAALAFFNELGARLAPGEIELAECGGCWHAPMPYSVSVSPSWRPGRRSC